MGKTNHAATSVFLNQKHPHVRGEDAFTPILKLPDAKHPHVRGEDVDGRAATRSMEETPPRAWGRHLKPKGISDMKGNTPTCVGKTLMEPEGGM